MRPYSGVAHQPAAWCEQLNVPFRCTASTASKSASFHLQQRPVADDPGVVHEDVDAAERVDRGR